MACTQNTLNVSCGCAKSAYTIWAENQPCGADISLEAYLLSQQGKKGPQGYSYNARGLLDKKADLPVPTMDIIGHAYVVKENGHKYEAGFIESEDGTKIVSWMDMGQSMILPEDK